MVQKPLASKYTRPRPLPTLKTKQRAKPGLGGVTPAKGGTKQNSNK
jgi:hypothetical protein